MARRFELRGLVSERERALRAHDAASLERWRQRMVERSGAAGPARKRRRERPRPMDALDALDALDAPLLGRSRDEGQAAGPQDCRQTVRAERAGRYRERLGEEVRLTVRGGRELLGKLVEVKACGSGAPHAIVLDKSPVLGPALAQAGAYDLATRQRSIAALDTQFKATLAAVEQHVVDEETRDARQRLRAAQRTYKSERGRLGAAPEPQECGPRPELAQAAARVQRAARLVDDAALYGALAHRYRPFDDALFWQLDLPGQAYWLRVQWASRRLAAWNRHHTARRRFARTLIAMRLQAAFRARQARLLASLLRKRHRAALRGLQRLRHRRVFRCWASWRAFVAFAHRARAVIEHMAFRNVRLCFGRWLALRRRRAETRAMLRARRHTRLLRSSLVAWRRRAARLKRKAAFEAACRRRRLAASWEVWAAVATRRLLAEHQRRHEAAVLLQRHWRGNRGRLRVRKMLRVALFCQSHHARRVVLHEFTRPHGLRYRLRALRRRRVLRDRAAAARQRQAQGLDQLNVPLQLPPAARRRRRDRSRPQQCASGPSASFSSASVSPARSPARLPRIPLANPFALMLS